MLSRIRVAFSTNRDGPENIYQKHATSTGDEEPVLKTPEKKFLLDWSRDGRYLLYQVLTTGEGWAAAAAEEPSGATGVGGNTDLWVLPLAGDRCPFQWLATPFVEDEATFSSDGRLVAYTSNATGRREVLVQTFPDPSQQWPVSREGAGGRGGGLTEKSSSISMAAAG